MTQHASGQQGGASKGSWLDRAIDIVKPQPGAPPRPAAPPVHEAQWHKSVERKEIVPGLTVHDVGLSVFGETRSLRDRPGSNEPIGAARQKIAHAMINDAELSHQTGKSRNKVHDPVEPPDQALHNPEERTAYESSLHAAREAYLGGHDPTQGANHLRIPTTPDRSNWKFQGGTREGLTISTQSGPYQNSLPNRDVPSRTAWINRYFPGVDEKKHHRKR
jgi:hypothetical protein